jgi:hypothetical protein
MDAVPVLDPSGKVCGQILLENEMIVSRLRRSDVIHERIRVLV